MKILIPNSLRFIPAALSLLFALLANHAGAVNTLCWDPLAAHNCSSGSSTSHNWSSSLWWNGTSDAAWVSGDLALIHLASTISLDASQTANGITFDNACTINTTTTTLTLNGTTPTFTVTSGSTFFHPIIAGSAGYTVTGAGLLVLDNAGTSVTGAINVSGGATLDVPSYHPIGNGGNAITLNNGTLENDDTTAENFLGTCTLALGASGGTISTPTSTTILLFPGAAISGSGSLTKTGSGEVRMDFASGNTFTGGLIVGGGVYTASTGTDPAINTMFGAIPGSTSATAIQIKNGAEIRLAGNTDISLNTKQGITLGTGGGCIDAVGGRAFTIPSVIAGSTLLTINGSLNGSDVGTVVLNGANTYSGGTTINGIGTLSIGADSGLGAVPGSVTTASITLVGGRLQSSGTFTLNAKRGITMTANSTIDVTTGQTLTYGGIIAGAFNLTTTPNNGKLILSGANTYTGTTTVSAGTLSVGADANLGTAPGSATATSITLGGGILNDNASFTLNANRGITLTAASTIDVSSSQTLTYGGSIVGTFNLIKTGAGTLILTAAATRSAAGGTTQIDGGVLRIQSGTALNTGTAAITTINNGGVLELNGGITLNQPITFNSGATLRSDGNNSNNGKVTVSSVASASVTFATVSSSDTFIIGNGANDVSGGSSTSTIHIAGPGTTLLAQSSDYTGNWSVDAGTLLLQSSVADLVPSRIIMGRD
jgi:autotransporter-associated beta strand protein